MSTLLSLCVIRQERTGPSLFNYRVPEGSLTTYLKVIFTLQKKELLKPSDWVCAKVGQGG